MGLNRLFSSCVYNTPLDPPTDGTPNKFRFELIDSYQKTKGGNQPILVKIKYNDCINYNGCKLLIYNNYHDFNTLLISGCIDPHFLEGKISPIARFEPTKNGWNLAIKFLEFLSEEKNNYGH